LTFVSENSPKLHRRVRIGKAVDNDSDRQVALGADIYVQKYTLSWAIDGSRAINNKPGVMVIVM